MNNKDLKQKIIERLNRFKVNRWEEWATPEKIAKLADTIIDIWADKVSVFDVLDVCESKYRTEEYKKRLTGKTVHWDRRILAFMQNDYRWGKEEKEAVTAHSDIGKQKDKDRATILSEINNLDHAIANYRSGIRWCEEEDKDPKPIKEQLKKTLKIRKELCRRIKA